MVDYSVLYICVTSCIGAGCQATVKGRLFICCIVNSMKFKPRLSDCDSLTSGEEAGKCPANLNKRMLPQAMCDPARNEARMKM